MSKLAANLQRLLYPRHIACIGGNDAALSAAQCATMFDGPVWSVNPKRATLGGVRCFASVDELPEAPDAVFLATPRAAALETIRGLRERGAGGVACFTAGYAELGEVGRKAERELVEAAGDMALVGPNCYGLINYTNGTILWPFGAGETRCDRGIALIMQSGMIPANLTMNARSVPITHVISAGNQAMLAIEDYVELLIDDARVTAIGLYIEGIRNLGKFSAAAARALAAGKPIVVLKAGASRLAARLSISHTGSLSGSDAAFQALFDRLGIIRVRSPAEMMETLKFLSVSGAPRGRRIAAFTCSGGEAALLADYCDAIGLELKQPSPAARERLAAVDRRDRVAEGEAGDEVGAAGDRGEADVAGRARTTHRAATRYRDRVQPARLHHAAVGQARNHAPGLRRADGRRFRRRGHGPGLSAAAYSCRQQPVS